MKIADQTKNMLRDLRELIAEGRVEEMKYDISRGNVNKEFWDNVSIFKSQTTEDVLLHAAEFY